MKALNIRLNKNLFIGLLLVVPLLVSGCQNNNSQRAIIFGISPYQDSYLPKLAEEKGWYKEAGLNVQTRTLAWGDLMNSVVSPRGADLVITNFNSFQAAYGELARQEAEPIFIYPLYIFKGAAIMVRSNSSLKSVNEIMASQSVSREEAVKRAANQLKGTNIIATKGTEMEQIVLAAAKTAGLELDTDYQITHASPEDGLAAFLGGEAVAYSGGLTEQFRARSEGAKVILEASDVTPPVINGIVTTRDFLNKNQDEIVKIIQIWFKIINYMEADLPNRSQEFLQYLNSSASVQYKPEEFKFAWNNMEVFFQSPLIVEKEVIMQDGNFYWRKIWDKINIFLVEQGDLKSPVPFEVFLGVETQKILKETTIKNSKTKVKTNTINSKNKDLKDIQLQPLPAN